MRRGLVVSLVLVATLVGAGSVGASRTQTCPTRSVGPGTLIRGGTAGAECMLRAYAHGCSPATYQLSSFGVDTVATSRFQLVRSSGACAITITRSFEVVPQKPHTLGVGRCGKLRRTAMDIVATGCRGGSLSATMSLTRG